MKTAKKSLKRRPKNVWNSVRKLEGYLRKADIQANLFMESLSELRDSVSLEVKIGIVRELCRSVNGDILHELMEHKKLMEKRSMRSGIGQNAVLNGIFDTLAKMLDLSPVRVSGERFRVNRQSAKDYDFAEYPQALDDGSSEEFEVEVLRCGWRVRNKLAVKPVVFEAKAKKEIRYKIDPLENMMFVTSGEEGQ